MGVKIATLGGLILGAGAALLGLSALLFVVGMLVLPVATAQFPLYTSVQQVTKEVAMTNSWAAALLLPGVVLLVIGGVLSGVGFRGFRDWVAYK
ncbi:MAG TPA: hypothetical protein VFS21_18570 [Roseiflexaceae bacterium]|nr:hypothetical protein [Roseiflexaceae bacterium]